MQNAECFLEWHELNKIKNKRPTAFVIVKAIKISKST